MNPITFDIIKAAQYLREGKRIGSANIALGVELKQRFGGGLYWEGEGVTFPDCISIDDVIETKYYLIEGEQKR